MFKYAFCFFLLLFPLGLFSFEKEVSEELKYFTPLNATEKQSIHYIMTILGTKSTLSLLLYRDELNRAGSQIMTVHPLRFWKEIFINSQLKQYSRKIGLFPKRRMVSDFIKSFQWVHNKGLFSDEQILDFSQVTGISSDKMNTIIREGQWNLLLDLLFQRTHM